MKLIAVKRTPFRYAGKDQKHGDDFEASEKDGALFKKLGWATDPGGRFANASDLPVEVMSRASKREPVTEVEEPAAVEEVAEVEEEPAVTTKVMKAEEAVEEDEAPKSQSYHRRDMVAETPKVQPVKPFHQPKKRGRPSGKKS